MAGAGGTDGWLEELTFPAAGPPWLAMGVGRVDDSEWLLVDHRRAVEIELRRRLLAARHPEVFAALPGTEEAGAEVLELVRAWLGRWAPGIELPPDDADPALHPLERAGRLVQEDLVVMRRRPTGAHHLDAACLCFPSHWRLADKLGGSASAIHGSIPRYAEDLAEKVDRYLDRLRPGTISKRRNWSVHDRPDLFAPRRPPATVVTGEAMPSTLWLRSERQTLRRLERSGDVLFTIRVQQAPLEVLRRRPAVAASLAARIRAQPAELSEMNGVAAYAEPLLRWLDEVAVGTRT